MSKIKDAMNAVTQGTYIVGAKVDGKINGMTAAWVTQISFNPCRVLVAVGKAHYTAELIEQAGCFSINVLSEQDKALALRCGFSSGRDIDKLSGVDVECAITGAPLIKGVKAHLDCKLTQSVQAGDHVLFIGEVVYGKVFDGSPMVYYEKDFFK